MMQVFKVTVIVEVEAQSYGQAITVVENAVKGANQELIGSKDQCRIEFVGVPEVKRVK